MLSPVFGFYPRDPGRAHLPSGSSDIPLGFKNLEVCKAGCPCSCVSSEGMSSGFYKPCMVTPSRFWCELKPLVVCVRVQCGPANSDGLDESLWLPRLSALESSLETQAASLLKLENKGPSPALLK